MRRQRCLASPSNGLLRLCGRAVVLPLLIASVSTVLPVPQALALSSKEKKAVVLAAPPDLLQTLGSHLIVGYHSASELTPLLSRGALGGVFITARNAKLRNKWQLSGEISRLRTLAAEKGQRPLWIAADQEGGAVARLTPPLPAQSSLNRLLRKTMTHHERDAIISDYATRQAGNLAGVGVNLNFSPVVDLRREGRLRGDRHTNLHLRAMFDDAGLVADAAKSYCRATAAQGVLCTLKHFPGLRTVNADTHISKARVLATQQALEARDWAPFWIANGKIPAAIMVSHAHLNDIDALNPASTSKAVISGLLRREWGYSGLVITDDFYMASIRKRPGGMSRAAVNALNAGADLIVITTGGNDTYHVLYELIEAYQDGRLDQTKLAASRLRLDTYTKQFAPSPTVMAPLPVASPRRTVSAKDQSLLEKAN